MADRIVVMQGGHVEQVGAPEELYDAPANLFVAGFIGSPAMNFLPATLTGQGTAARFANGDVVGFLDGRRAGAEGLALTIGIRPEHVVLAAGGRPFLVDLVEPLGSETVLIGRLGEGQLLSVKVAGGARHSGELAVEFPPAAFHVFDGTTGLRMDAVAA